MKADLKIGEKTFTAEANGMSPIYYRDAFNRDVFIDLGINLERAENDKAEEIDQNIYARIAYIITGEHKKKSFEKFMMQFEAYDIFIAAQDIMNVWDATTKTVEEEEKKEKKKGKN